MPELPSSGRSHLRARRWDAVVLGGALPGLVTAAHLCLGGKRVLVVEEERSTRAFDPVREPFVLTGAAGGGVLGEVLRDLAVPLIDLRRLEPDPITFQVVMPDARLDVGAAARTAEELVGWGLAKPDTVQPLLRALQRAAAAEHDAMLASPVVRTGGLRRLGRSSGTPTRHARGMPAEAAAAPPELAPFFEAQLRALSNLDTMDPGPEARARLLGAVLDGAHAFPSSETTLRGLLRARVRALHGEFRALPGGFELISAEGEPGIAPARSTELWLGRALVVNAPFGTLTRFFRANDAPVPAMLDAAEPRRRRRAMHLHTRADVVPEGMARRVIHVADPAVPIDGANAISISVHPAAGSSDAVDVVATAACDIAAGPAADAAIEATVRDLMPFSDERLVSRPVETPQWDDDAVLEDPPRAAAWPADVEVRISSRPPVYALPRAAVAGLGVEGDILLGWRAGERIGADLG